MATILSLKTIEWNEDKGPFPQNDFSGKIDLIYWPIGEIRST